MAFVQGRFFKKNNNNTNDKSIILMLLRNNINTNNIPSPQGVFLPWTNAVLTCINSLLCCFVSSLPQRFYNKPGGTIHHVSLFVSEANLKCSGGHLSLMMLMPRLIQVSFLKYFLLSIVLQLFTIFLRKKITMRQCAAFACTNTSCKGSKLSFHRYV